jgi:hypothetical protein
MMRSAAKAKREQADVSADKLKIAATSLLNDSQKVSPNFHSLGGGGKEGRARQKKEVVVDDFIEEE